MKEHLRTLQRIMKIHNLTRKNIAELTHRSEWTVHSWFRKGKARRALKVEIIELLKGKLK
jgi:DNA-binding transcriptional regulator LsrR (DeoR family)